jgi:anti-sigma factor RsiW
VTDSTSDPHLRDSLGLYLLGSLGPRERAEVERHLATCPDCRRESDQLGEVVAALALLSEEEGREVAEEFGVRPADLPSGATGLEAATPPHPVLPVSPRRGPRRTRALLSIAALMLVVFVSVGIFVTVYTTGDASTRVTLTVAATAADTSTGATVSVVASGHDGRVTIRATVTGLHAGTAYQLYAVTSDGATHVVTSWTGSDAPQDVTGDLPVSPRQLSFFTVTLADSTPVVSAYLR